MVQKPINHLSNSQGYPSYRQEDIRRAFPLLALLSTLYTTTNNGIHWLPILSVRDYSDNLGCSPHLLQSYSLPPGINIHPMD